MPEAGTWQASLLEQRMAWGIAVCCLVFVLIASARPEWFDFSAPKPEANVKQATLTNQHHQHKAIPHPHKPHMKASQAKPHAAPPIKPHNMHSKPMPTTKPSPLAKGFYVQLGAFKERQRAQGLADLMQRKGWQTVLANKQNGLHAVWAGPKKTYSEAEKLRKAIHRKLKNKGFIVHH